MGTPRRCARLRAVSLRSAAGRGCRADAVCPIGRRHGERLGGAPGRCRSGCGRRPAPIEADRVPGAPGTAVLGPPIVSLARALVRSGASEGGVLLLDPTLSSTATCLDRVRASRTTPRQRRWSWRARPARRTLPSRRRPPAWGRIVFALVKTTRSAAEVSAARSYLEQSVEALAGAAGKAHSGPRESTIRWRYAVLICGGVQRTYSLALSSPSSRLFSESSLR